MVEHVYPENLAGDGVAPQDRLRGPALKSRHDRL